MILGITGHRPPKIGGYNTPNPIYNFVISEIENKFLELKPEKILSGMALGTDQHAAEIAIKLNIPFDAIIPFYNYESKWSEHIKEKYYNLLSKANKVYYVSHGEYSAIKLQLRNEFIVDNSHELLAIYDGVSTGGTFNCIQYAKSKHKQITYINCNITKQYIRNN